MIKSTLEDLNSYQERLRKTLEISCEADQVKNLLLQDDLLAIYRKQIEQWQPQMIDVAIDVIRVYGNSK